jgi:hypothetical protein
MNKQTNLYKKEQNNTILSIDLFYILIGNNL